MICQIIAFDFKNSFPLLEPTRTETVYILIPCPKTTCVRLFTLNPLMLATPTFAKRHQHLFACRNPDTIEGNCDRDALLSKSLSFASALEESIHPSFQGRSNKYGGVATDKWGRSNSTL